MIVDDTSVWIDFLSGRPTPQVGLLQDLLGAELLLVGDLILLEVLQGVRSEAEAARVAAALGRFDIPLMLDPQLAVLAASHYRRLRTLGVTMRKTVDLIIGTFCIANDHALLTADRDFIPMATHLGLRLV